MALPPTVSSRGWRWKPRAQGARYGGTVTLATLRRNMGERNPRRNSQSTSDSGIL